MISTRALLLLFTFFASVLLPSTRADGSGAVIDEEDDEYADPEVVEPALLVAYKSIKTPKIVQGCNVTIAVSLFNVGAGCDPFLLAAYFGSRADFKENSADLQSTSL